MAHKSALSLVISQQIPVDPKGGQPRYFRSKKSVQTSPKLAYHQSCLSEKMKNKSFSNREEVQDAFEDFSKECKNENPH